MRTTFLYHMRSLRPLRHVTSIYPSGFSSRLFSATTAPKPGPDFLTGENSVYVDEMFALWKQDRTKVHPSWDVYFSNAEKGLQAFVSPFELQSILAQQAQQQYHDQPLHTRVSSSTQLFQQQQQQQQLPVQNAQSLSRRPSFSIAMTEEGARRVPTQLVHLIRAYQTNGHLKARIDPLNMMKHSALTSVLDPKTYGFTEEDLENDFDLSGYEFISGYLKSDRSIKLGKLVKILEKTYCGTIGIEFMHIMDRERCNFIRERFETNKPVFDQFSNEQKLQVLDRLLFACELESFLAKKWNTSKRFGLEGCESFIPGFKALIDKSTELGVENVFIGMPHRGRLNVLANVMRKPLSVIFREFEGTMYDAEQMYMNLEETYALSGDVKYHLGASFSRSYPDGRGVHISLAANPSHLEAVDPVVEGRAKAKQFYDGDKEGHKTLPVLIHGDAAFCGQGVVYETMHMSQLPTYSTGGTVHVIVNNQIGFTTDPHHSRSTRYPTDLGKAFDCPIFHVNADDPLAVVYVFKVAAEWRQKFHSDVIIDITGYRQMGHNEMDQPFFTQPEMYNIVKKKQNVAKIYKQVLLDNKVLDDERLKGIENFVQNVFQKEYELSRSGKVEKEEWLESPKWSSLIHFGKVALPKKTSVSKEILLELGIKANTPPEDFTVHPTLKKMLESRIERLKTGKNLDWALGEQLAFASLLSENKHVRISGQDSQRGTFAHRHAVLHDQKTFKTWTGLNDLFPAEAVESGKKQQFTASNSSLSEFGVMGFELGYSLEDPDALVIWEAQFGDFTNGAQIIIDQFLSCGEQKWNRQCGLVLLLPHGYDGQGPDHSSCRLERFLQQSDEDPDEVPKDLGTNSARPIQDSNWQVVNCTTPAQIFHALRRQIHRDFRKPLIVASPKNILRTAVSDLEEFTAENARFQPLLSETDKEIESNPDKVKKLIFCSGKIYYELAKEREDKQRKDVAIVRIEQIMPFPFNRVAEEVKKYKNAQLLYVQEEPKNMGAWYYVDDRIYTSIKHYLNEHRRCQYIGRGTMSSTAVGYTNVHLFEQRKIIEKAFSDRQFSK